RIGGRQLWVTLASLRLQTAREVRRWRTDRPRVQVILEGVDKVDPRAQVVIVSFDHMRSIAIWQQLFALDWQVLTIDEAHRLSSPSAKTTKAIYGARLDSKGALYRKAEHVWIATGTPVVNWPNELWTHMSRLWPELVADVVNENGRPTYDAWRDRFCHVRMAGFGKQITGGREPLE
ncbi:MAG: SNF2-related protein, partial [Phycisphaerae bacterium]